MRANKTDRKIHSYNTFVEYLKSGDEFKNLGPPVHEKNRKVSNVNKFKDENTNFKSKVRSRSFLETFSIKDDGHRFKRLDRQKQIKILYFIGHFGIIVGCMYQCFSFLTIYFNYPTTVELDVENEAVLDFPAVTVCNSNPVKYKIWCKEDEFLCKKKINETIEEYRIRQGDQYDRLKKEKRIQLGYELNEFIILALYEDNPVITTFQRYYDFEFTNCYTFNANWGPSSPPLKQAFVFNPVTGKSSELHLCVNMDIGNYSNITGRIVGRTQMTIHANDIIPNPSYDSASLEAGSYYSYGIQKVTTRLLKSPYQTKCRNYEEEREYRTGARMSQRNCLLECFKTETEKMCGCTYQRLALMYDAISCEKNTEFNCLEKADEQVFDSCNPQCPMACQKVEFQYVATDAEPLREELSLFDNMPLKELFPTPDDMNQNMACMSIHYGSTETRTLSHRPKYAFIELFSLLGGYSGLWLGFSLLNGYEIFLVKIIGYFFRKKEEKIARSKILRKRRKYY